MSDTSFRVETLSNRHPDAKQVGPHQVVEQTERVPGKHPDPHKGYEGQTEYLERFLKCVVCGEDRLQKRDFSQTCEPGRDAR
jgi:hypothetical protein